MLELEQTLENSPYVEWKTTNSLLQESFLRDLSGLERKLKDGFVVIKHGHKIKGVSAKRLREGRLPLTRNQRLRAEKNYITLRRKLPPEARTQVPRLRELYFTPKA